MALTAAEQKLKEKREENQLLRMLDRGIDDMEAGRELPLQSAFQKIDELREKRTNTYIEGIA